MKLMKNLKVDLEVISGLNLRQRTQATSKQLANHNRELQEVIYRKAQRKAEEQRQ